MTTLQYKKEYCEMLIDHMSKGLSFMSFGGVVRVSRTALYQWVDKYPEFKEAKQIAESTALLWYEKRLTAKGSGQDLTKAGIDVKKIDTTALIFPMKTRFHEVYGERQKIEQTHQVSEETKKLIINLND